jgi:mono/diheme cytochrome c family protein
MKRFVWPVVAAAVVIAVVAVVALGGDPPPPRDPMTGESEFDIPVQDPGLVAEGEVLYQTYCASCHGADLRGTDLGPSHLSIVYNPNHHGDGAFAIAALSGVPAHHWNFGDMAPVPGLLQDDLDRIIAFVRETQRVEGFEAYPPR